MTIRAALVELVTYAACVLAIDHACRQYQRHRNTARAADMARHPAHTNRAAYIRGATAAIATPEAIDLVEAYANGEVSA